MSVISTKNKLEYCIDIVMCIDVTQSMYPFLAEVKNKALTLYESFSDGIERRGKSLQQLRVKVIAFRDFAVDPEPFKVSDFFILGDAQGNQTEEFNSFINSIEAVGGGDLPENSLEALAMAIKSDWVKTGSVRRHIVLMFTDAEALELGTNATAPNYPANMPANMAELRELWESQEMEAHAKRLFVCAPDCTPWNTMVEWSNTFHQASKTGAGLPDADIEAYLNLIIWED